MKISRYQKLSTTNYEQTMLLLIMLTVSLHGAEFFAYHGFYPEEQLLGCRFVLNIDVSFEPATEGEADEIANTVNYEQLYAIAQQEMQQTKKLLETVVEAIGKHIRAAFPFVQNIRVEMKKLNPPMGGSIAYSAVTFTDYNG